MLISDWSSDECSSDLDRPPMVDRTVLVVDEASTLADRDLAALLTMAGRTGSTVRLIGDPDQHGAVAAGGMFRHLCTTHPNETPQLATTHRVRSHADPAAARLLRARPPHQALPVPTAPRTPPHPTTAALHHAQPLHPRWHDPHPRET